MADLFGDDPQDVEPGPVPFAPAPSRDGFLLDNRPLADFMRPASFDDYLGQEKLLGASAPLRKLIEAGRVPSMMLWGPPGSGKTTLARLVADHVEADFVTLSAVTSSVRDVRQVIDAAKANLRFARRTILFVDEIHRFNKAQQDAFLPHVESGIITLIGATTENPSFSVISPLLSRCRVFILEPLAADHVVTILRRGMEQYRRRADAPGQLPDPEEDALRSIVSLSDGDARRALGLLEIALAIKQSSADLTPLTRDDVAAASQRHLVYDRQGEEHFNLISALHKTLRSSDPHAALYWMGRMLAAGEDPLYIARRLVRFASEDIGLADPNALPQAMEALRAYQALGSPEGELALVQACAYLALAPKSNALYRAYKDVRATIAETGSLAVPLHLRNAPTDLMKQAGYGDGYTYDHDGEGNFIPKQGLPDEISRQSFYTPTANGWEGERRGRLEEWDRRRRGEG